MKLSRRRFIELAALLGPMRPKWLDGFIRPTDVGIPLVGMDLASGPDETVLVIGQRDASKNWVWKVSADGFWTRFGRAEQGRYEDSLSAPVAVSQVIDGVEFRKATANIDIKAGQVLLLGEVTFTGEEET